MTSTSETLPTRHYVLADDTDRHVIGVFPKRSLAFEERDQSRTSTQYVYECDCPHPEAHIDHLAKPKFAHGD